VLPPDGPWVFDTNVYNASKLACSYKHIYAILMFPQKMNTGC